VRGAPAALRAGLNNNYYYANTILIAIKNKQTERERKKLKLAKERDKRV